MKFQTLLSIASLIIMGLWTSCGSEGEKDVNLASEQALTQESGPQAPVKKEATPEPPQNAAGVWHYTCPKGCPGGSGSATPCSTCGTALVHNQAYHGAVGSAANAAPANNPAQNSAPAPGAKQPEPPQNAAGVWHYTCAKGCAGGAGSAIICPKCGNQLVHNKSYH